MSNTVIEPPTRALQNQSSKIPADKNSDPTAQDLKACNQVTRETVPIPLPEERHITVRRKPGLSANNEVFPYIALGGKYLKQFGFYLGKSISVRLEANKITLTVDEPGEGPAQKALEESAIRNILSMRELQYRLILTQEYLYNHSSDQTGQSTG